MIARDADADGAAARRERRLTLVWDLPVRLFHWLLAALIAAAYATWRLNWMDWHAWIGEALLALVLFRLLWGLWGSDTARFSRFVASPRRAFKYLARLFRREPDTQAGHNPAGGWMVLLLLALVLAQALTGVYVNNDVADQGPLTDLSPAAVENLVTALHDTVLWTALLGAIVVHVIAVLFYRVVKGQDLIRPMITGRKSLPADAPTAHARSLARAFVLLVCAAAAAAAIGAYM